MERYFEQTKCINVLPARCYYVPFDKAQRPSDDREDSSLYTSLNGEWEIKEFPTFLDVPDDFYAEKLENKIPVPSCVQYYGYDNFMYSTHYFPIPFDPPYVDNLNPCYHYRRFFNVDFGDKQYLNFEGVDSCFYVYINDKFVGFSQIAHRVSEFDVTDFVRKGENKLDVLVLKYGAGTYLEDQDKWRFTGIFRDVYLLSRPARHVTDYFIKASADGRVEFTLTQGCECEVLFRGESRKVKEGETVEFTVNAPHLWSPESPYLYDLEIVTDGERILEEVGLRDTYCKDGVYYFNGKPVKFRGVNRHDFMPDKGAAVSREDIFKDLLLMKSLNVNAIRTSHYPNEPEFYKMCDRLGFYVMSESDMESHGSCDYIPPLDKNHPRNKDPQAKFSHVASLPMFFDSITERQKCNVLVNRNRPCVVIWSLGNESGWEEGMDRAARWVKANDYRPVHYESSIHYPRSKYTEDDFYAFPIDFYSRMYPPVDEMKTWVENAKMTNPFVLCEYCHAMGNGPGDFKDYWQVMESSERFCGGFVWEWADHGVLFNGKGFKYGGDFGEEYTNGNFCIDGIVAPDRKIKTGTLEMKAIYAPVAITKHFNIVTLACKNYFMPADINATVIYSSKGKETSKEYHEFLIPPQESVSFEVKDEDEIFVEVRPSVSMPGVSRDNVIAWQGWSKDKFVLEPRTYSGKVEFDENNRYVFVKAGSTKYRLDKVSGQLDSIDNGGEILKSPLAFNIYRAPTDNDRNIRNKWKNERMNYAFAEARKVTVEGTAVRVEGFVGSEKYLPIVNFTAYYQFFDEGVTVSVDYAKDPNFTWLPRFGLTLHTFGAFGKAEYFGYGPYESYIDKRLASHKGYFKTTLKDNFVHYIYPQENGAHYDTSFVEITDGKRAIRAEDKFSFDYSPYSVEQLESAMHDGDLPKSDDAYLQLDFYMSGIGSNSCGPQLADKYKTPDRGWGSVTIIVKNK